MNNEVKAKWVAALRSGDYQQTTSQLRSDETSFCCLGVLCDISGVGDWGYDRESGADDASYHACGASDAK